ncbi:MAG: hypothetical protein AB7H90_10220 [Alphaproteobacteria bacterium]
MLNTIQREEGTAGSFPDSSNTEASDCSDPVIGMLVTTRRRIQPHDNPVALLEEIAAGDAFKYLDALGDLHDEIPRLWRFWYGHDGKRPRKWRQNLIDYWRHRGPDAVLALLDRAIERHWKAGDEPIRCTEYVPWHDDGSRVTHCTPHSWLTRERHPRVEHDGAQEIRSRPTWPRGHQITYECRYCGHLWDEEKRP